MKLQLLYIPVAAAYGLALLAALFKRKKIALGCLAGAFVLQAGFLAARSFFFGFFNGGGVLEEPAFLSFCLSGIVLWLWLTRREEEGAALIPAAVLFGLLYLFMPKGLLPPSAKSASIFVSLFFFCEILAHALFIAAAMLALRLLLKGEGFEQAHQFAVWGFVFYTIAQVTGAVWCYLGWSVPFQWGLRHLQSAGTWCFFANYLHLRFIPWWTDRRRCGYIVAGALIIISFQILLQLGEVRQLRIGS